MIETTYMNQKAQLQLEGKTYELPTVTGSEGEKAVDISTLRDTTGYITLDDGYANTGSCSSAVTFIDGEKGILRYRGIPIEELAEKSTFVETAYLLIYGKLPGRAEKARFSELLTENENLHEGMKHHFEGFPPSAHPMAILSAMINASSCFYPGLMGPQLAERFDIQAARLISQVRTIAAFSYRKSRGLPFVYPKPSYKYTANFLHMMFSDPYESYELKPEVVRALDLIFLLHADHEQNCSTSTVRMVASSEANLVRQRGGGGVRALGAAARRSQPGGDQHAGGNPPHPATTGADSSAAAKDKDSGKRLMGFGHRVYKNYDPRAKIIKEASDSLLHTLHREDPLLDIARKLEEAALHDSYFVERKLYPNVDFYSGIMMRAIGIPTEMFTVMFAIGRMPGWIANFKEIMDARRKRICRPAAGLYRADEIPLRAGGRAAAGLKFSMARFRCGPILFGKQQRGYAARSLNSRRVGSQLAIICQQNPKNGGLPGLAEKGRITPVDQTVQNQNRERREVPAGKIAPERDPLSQRHPDSYYEEPQSTQCCYAAGPGSFGGRRAGLPRKARLSPIKASWTAAPMPSPAFTTLSLGCTTRRAAARRPGAR